MSPGCLQEQVVLNIALWPVKLSLQSRKWHFHDIPNIIVYIYFFSIDFENKLF